MTTGPDIRYVNLARALGRMNGNLPSYRRLGKMFLDQQAGFVAEYEAVTGVLKADLAHRLKGSAGTLGLEALHQLAADQEAALRDGKTLAPEDSTAMADLFVASTAALRAWLDEQVVSEVQSDGDGQAPAVVSRADLASLHAQVSESLRRFSRPPNTLVEELAKALDAHGLPAQPLRDRLAAFDFSGALDFLKSLSVEKLP